MDKFKGSIFGPSYSAGGEAAEGSFTKGLFIVDGIAAVDVSDISVSVGGFDHKDLFLNWSNENGEKYSFSVNTKTESGLLAETAPASITAQLGQWKQRKTGIKLVWGTVLSLAIFCCISTFAIWLNYDATLGWIASHISPKQEKALGESVLSQFKSDHVFISEGQALKVVEEIGDSLSKGSLYDYQWHIISDPSINAFALPGGIIVVNSGLIENTDHANELAAVLAHEIQHVERRHSLKSLLNSLGVALGLIVVLGDAGIATALIAHQMGNLYFSREKEEEADTLAYELLSASNINPAGIIDLLNKLKPADEAPKVASWLSSHPNIIERITNITQLLKDRPCKQCEDLSYDWEKIKSDPYLNPDYPPGT